MSFYVYSRLHRLDGFLLLSDWMLAAFSKLGLARSNTKTSADFGNEA